MSGTKIKVSSCTIMQQYRSADAVYMSWELGIILIRVPLQSFKSRALSTICGVPNINYSMQWHYTPISIRIVPRDDTPPHCLSGINAVLVDNQRVVADICLTICHLPIDELEHQKVYVSAQHLIQNDRVPWHSAYSVTTIPVFSDDDPLFEYIKYALKQGFNFIPLDTLVGNSLKGSLNLMQFNCRTLYSSASLLSYRELKFQWGSEMLPISVRSSPFNVTNPVLFSSFVSAGHINSVLRNGKTAFGYLSDIKYLENMCGAVVNGDSGSIGMLLGNLRKLNGDGDLMVIAPWERLLEKLMSHLKNEERTLMDLVTPDLNEAQSHLVFPLVLSQNGKYFSWGSCLLLTSHTLVTNYHVLKPFYEKVGKCNVIMGLENITLSLDDRVIVPYPELDLAFVELSLLNQMNVSHFQPVKLGNEEAEVQDEVYTAGYGLILNETSLKPLVSRGHISSKTSLPCFENGPKSPCMLINSSLCWNGSSGGGLFNNQGRLVGLICSNAQVFVPVVTGERSSKTEKVPLFCLCIPIELILECYKLKVLNDLESKLKEEVGRTWRLESNHTDVYEREAKL